jgi:hypothetical protein
LSANDAGYGGRSHTENAEKIGMFVKIAVRIEGFDQVAGVNANECNLFGETGDIGGFDPGKVTLFKATGIETVFKVVEVARRCATATRRGSGRHEFVL